MSPTMNTDVMPRPCPYCGNKSVRLQFRQAPNHKGRYGRYDAAMYCGKCYAYGPRIRSEDLDIDEIDIRNYRASDAMKELMRWHAVKAWNNSKDYEKDDGPVPPLFEKGE